MYGDTTSKTFATGHISIPCKDAEDGVAGGVRSVNVTANVAHSDGSNYDRCIITITDSYAWYDVNGMHHTHTINHDPMTYELLNKGSYARFMDDLDTAIDDVVNTCMDTWATDYDANIPTASHGDTRGYATYDGIVLPAA